MCQEDPSEVELERTENQVAAFITSTRNLVKFGISTDSLNIRAHEKHNLVRSLSSLEIWPIGQG